MKKSINSILFGINSLICFALILAYCTSLVSPSTTSFFAFFGLIYPFLMLINILFLCYWILVKSKKVLLPILVFVLGFNHFSNSFQFSFSNNDTSLENSISVMSYNVRLFDLYDWTKEKNIKQRIIDFINEKKPAILCIQEYYSDGNKERLKKALGFNYVYEYLSQEKIKKGKKTGVGSAIFSRYKIVNQGKILFGKKKANHSIYIDVIKGDDTVRIYNAHLGSIRFDYDDYTFISGRKQKTKEKENLAFFKVLKRLKSGFENRVGQVEKLLEHIQNSPYPTIVGADMNDTPVSYSYSQFSKLLADSFTENGNRFGSTYSGLVPFLRIDYLWYNEKVKSLNFQTSKEVYSDHKAILGNFKLKK